MNAKKPASGITLKSDLERLDAYVPKAEDYAELPEVTEDMLKKGVVKRAGRWWRRASTMYGILPYKESPHDHSC